MKKYIGATEAVNALCANIWDSCFWPDIKETIKELPAADVVEVVRCKDCKFFPGGYLSDDRIMIETYMHCPNFKDNGFCSYGRKKK